MFLFADDTILYIKTQKSPPKTIRTNKFRKVAGYNVGKKVEFLYILPVKEITKTIPFIIA